MKIWSFDGAVDIFFDVRCSSMYKVPQKLELMLDVCSVVSKLMMTNLLCWMNAGESGHEKSDVTGKN